MNSPTQQPNPNLREYLPKPFALIAMFISVLAVSAGCSLQADRHNMSGIQEYQSGHPSQAINEFQKALTADPQNADAYYNLAASYVALGNQSKNQQWLEQGEQLYRQAIAKNPLFADAYRGLAALLVETGREQAAFDLLQTWQQQYPESTQPLIELARLYSEYGDNRRANDLLTDALKIDSNNVIALTALGHIRESQGQYQLALDNYMRVLQLDPQQTEVATRVAALQTRIAQLPPGTTAPATPAPYGSASPYTSR